MITHVTFEGPLIAEHNLPGVRRADGVFPAHPSGIPLSKNRWLLLCSPRGVRCHDDDHSIVYQLRQDRPDGTLLREGFIAQGSEDWDALGDGRRFVKQLRHPMAFGVPKGALIDGKPAAHANVFALQWHQSIGGILDPATGTYEPFRDGLVRHHEVRWGQFRLNDADDDIEVIAPDQTMRQNGYEAGPAFCRHEQVQSMIQSLVPAVPIDGQCTQWVIANRLAPSIAVIKFQFNSVRGLYEWVETGPLAPLDPTCDLTEASLARSDDGFVLGVRARRRNAGPPDWAGGTARDRGDTAWMKLADPMAQIPPAVVVQDPNRQAPMTVHTCADGVVRMFSGDFTNSPHKQRRDPLYCWDIAPGSWHAGNQKVIVDTIRDGIFANDATLRSTCFAAVLPHLGGDSQYVLFRCMVFRYRAGVDPKAPAITPEQLARCGTYYAKLHYDRSYPSRWDFAV